MIGESASPVTNLVGGLYKENINDLMGTSPDGYDVDTLESMRRLVALIADVRAVSISALHSSPFERDIGLLLSELISKVRSLNDTL